MERGVAELQIILKVGAAGPMGLHVGVTSSTLRAKNKSSNVFMVELGYLIAVFAPDRACGGRCLVLEMEISAHEVRCLGHAAAGHGLVTGQGWFRHYQHRLGRTGVGVGEPVFRLLRRDDPSHSANRSVKVQVSRTPEVGSCQPRARTGNAGPTARGSVIGGTDLGQPSRLGIART